MKRRLRTLLLLAAIILAAAGGISAATPATATKHHSPSNHFAWGAEVGGNVDLTSHDMSTINIAAYFGYRNSWIDMLGIGAEIDMMVSDSNRAFPIYAMLRTNFRQRPSVCFLDMRVGCAFNNLSDDETRAGLYVSPGLGINLAKGRGFQSYLIVNYTFNNIRPYDTTSGARVDIHGLHSAGIRLGILF